MIQIPLEIGDTILAGRFKNKKIKVNEITYDEYGSPAVNGRSILKIRIPKLYQKQENNMKLKESTNLFSKQTNVKIKQENKRWHIYLETVDGDECLTPVGYETKEQAEHAAMMKGYNFKGNPYSKDYEGLEVEKPTKREAAKGTVKPEEMKLSKEKEIKLESMIRRAIREISKKTVKLKEDVDKQKIRKQIEDYIEKTWSKKPHKGQIRFRGDLLVIDNVENEFGDWTSSIASAATGKKWDHVSASIAKLKESFKLKEELSQSELEQKARRFAELAQKMKAMESELKQMEMEYTSLDQELTPLVEQVGKTKDTFIRAGKLLIKIERAGYEKKNASYKTGFEYLYNKVNATMKDLAEEALKMTQTVSYVKSKISVVQGESNLKEENWFQKIKNFLGSKIKKLFGLNNQANQLLTQLESKI